MTAGGTVAAAGVLAVGAFAAAGDPLAAPPVTTTALSQVSAHTPADGRALTTEQIGSLRQEGWACPVLESMGFHLESARAVVRGGQPAVELRLSDGDHYAKVVEQHAGSTAATLRPAGQQAGQQAAAPQDSAPPWTATYTAGGRTFSFESDLPAEQAVRRGRLSRGRAPRTGPGGRAAGQPAAARHQQDRGDIYPVVQAGSAPAGRESSPAARRG
jgi:hypothetical protein